MKIQQGREEINSIGGISLIGALLDNVKTFRKLDKMTFDKVKKGVNSHSGILRSIVGLPSMGRSDFADIELFHDNLLFRDCLRLSHVPSEEILRQRLNYMASENRDFRRQMAFHRANAALETRTRRSTAGNVRKSAGRNRKIIKKTRSGGI